MKWKTGEFTSQDYRLAGGLFVFFFLLYRAASLPGLGWYDSAEFQTTAPLLGLSHPPGYPLINLLGRLACRFLLVEPARALTLLSVFFGSLVPPLLFLTLRRLKAGLAAALIPSLAFGLSPAFWEQAVKAEVYTLDLSLLLLALLLPGLCPSPSGSWALAGLSWSLALGHRPTGILVLPWALHFLPLRPRRIKLWPRTLLLSLSGALAGLSVLLYLPLRSRPSALRVFFGAESLHKFTWLIEARGFWDRVRFQGPGLLPNALETASVLFEALDPLLLLLGWLGFLSLVRRRARSSLGPLLSLTAALAFGVVYEVKDLPAFLLPALLGLALLSGLGLDSLERDFGSRWKKRALAWSSALLLIQTPLVYRIVDESRNRSADHFLRRALPGLPSLAALVQDMTSPDWARIAPLWYAVYVKKIRPDLRLVDDFHYLDLKAGDIPEEPTFVLKEDPALAGRFQLEPQGPLYRVRPRPWPSPASRPSGLYHALDLSAWGNADYRHDASFPNPTLGRALYPDLEPGWLNWKGVPFLIAPPYGASGKPPVLSTCYQAGGSWEIQLEDRPTDEVWLLVSGRGFEDRALRLGFLGLRLNDGSLLGRELLSLVDVWDAEDPSQEAPSPDAARAFGSGGKQTLTTLGLFLPKGCKPRALVIRGLSGEDVDQAPAGFTVFAVTQAFSR